MAHISNAVPLAVRLPCMPGPYQDATPVCPSHAEQACASRVRLEQSATDKITAELKYW
jgi:hypothetical protein